MKRHKKVLGYGSWVMGHGLLIIFLFLTSHLLPITYNPLPVSLASASETADDAVNRIQKEFELIRDISGRFAQKSYIKDLEQTHEFNGAFFLKKPGNMMWEYENPRDEKVVIRNKETFIYKKSQNQVMRTKFSEESYSQVPIAMLESFDNIRNDFEITMPEKNALQLIPRKKIGHVKTVILEEVHAIAIVGAAVMGAMIPHLFRLLGVDPAIAAGPLITTLIEMEKVTREDSIRGLKKLLELTVVEMMSALCWAE